MKKLSLVELQRLSIQDFQRKTKFPIIFCADQIRSGHNIGALFRISDAFAFQEIILANYCVKPPHPEIEKTALGSTNTVKWSQADDLVEELLSFKSKGYQLIGIEQTDQSVLISEFSVNTEQKYILIFGHEVNGISQPVIDILDLSLEIPQFGTKHSLNVSVAAGIVAWHFINPWFSKVKQ